MHLPISKKIVEQEVQQMLVEANGNFEDMIQNLMIEAGGSIAKQAMHRHHQQLDEHQKQEREVKATAPKEIEIVEKNESPRRPAVDLATVDNVEDDDESSGDAEEDL
jgi:phage anti-repressor protein